MTNENEPDVYLKHIPIKCYRAPDGKPTCALSIAERKMCIFLRTAKMGMMEVCALDTADIALERRKNQDGERLGYLIPTKHCILHGND